MSDTGPIGFQGPQGPGGAPGAVPPNPLPAGTIGPQGPQGPTPVAGSTDGPTMLAPPATGDPFDLIPPGTTNAHYTGGVVAWDAFRQFYGGVINGGWNQLQTAKNIGI